MTTTRGPFLAALTPAAEAALAAVGCTCGRGGDPPHLATCHRVAVATWIFPLLEAAAPHLPGAERTRQDLVLALLHERGPMDARALAVAAGLDGANRDHLSAIRGTLRRALRAKLVTFTPGPGPGEVGRWELVPGA